MKAKTGFSPSLIDSLRNGSLNDPLSLGLSVKVLSSGKLAWKYMRWLPFKRLFLRRTLGLYPHVSIAQAREAAAMLNQQIDAGVDPREIEKEKNLRESMTVNRAHVLYMTAVREGRHLKRARLCKPVTIDDKIWRYEKYIKPKIGSQIIYNITEDQLIRIIKDVQLTAKIQSNRVISEVRVFFRWASSLRGLEIGLEKDPACRLGDLQVPEYPKSRILNLDEIEWLLHSISDEAEYLRRAILLYLLTAVRRSELEYARFDELQDDVWIIPGGRTKNAKEHKIPLGPWGLKLFLAEVDMDAEWVFPSEKIAGPRKNDWSATLRRIIGKMSTVGCQNVPMFTLHDLRRTFRSNTKRVGIDYETAEAMLNHSKTGLDKVYDLYDHDNEKRSAFLAWENEILRIAKKAGIEQLLDAPRERIPSPPEGSSVKPSLDI
ncbi:tyrosine-type recombinase/integrase [Sphingobium sp. AR-3-1]|uniref:Tyrosine-type recombinase/integrase n=1 Tax=Sphingobium psychrophilum TaxID=2728834 RepID=A0A7X9ZUE3_9SPHN|nr:MULTISPECIES: site-specific integrase [Sphingobium]NML12592.1 tyrosine-type recombinase/integrase [Sphingobium psychrophilum]